MPIVTTQTGQVVTTWSSTPSPPVVTGPPSAARTLPYRTSSDLVLEALANLGILAAGQSVAPEDFAYIETRLDSIFRELAALEIVYVPDPNNIPGEWFLSLADIVAGRCAMKFGAGPEFIAAGLGNPPGSGMAAQSLKIMLRGRPTFEPQRTESF